MSPNRTRKNIYKTLQRYDIYSFHKQTLRFILRYKAVKGLRFRNLLAKRRTDYFFTLPSAGVPTGAANDANEGKCLKQACGQTLSGITDISRRCSSLCTCDISC